ncbi:MAG: hypothetical protein Q4G63_09095 [Bacteroidia bacterium]|nr:hypothetical protein [Bacteroidia bacterium]
MNITDKRFLSLIAFLAIAITTFAQQVGSNSPYGRYGYGLLSNQSFGASEAMGGISYGLRRSQQVNPGNPASYSKLDSLTFIFDLGISGHYATFNDGINKQNFYNGNLDYIAMQFPIIKKVGASIGLLPFSKVGYNYGRARSLSNIVYEEVFRGTGGLSQIYAGIAYEPFNHFSVGANISYLFGNFSYSNVSVPRTTTGATIGEEKKSYSIRDLKYDFGAQFTLPVNKTSSLTVGAVYSPKITSKTNVYATQMMFLSDPYSNPYQNPSEILRNDTLSNQQFQLPHTYGLGITYSNTNLLVGVDGTFQQWNKLNYPDVLDGLTTQNRFNNTYKVNAGAEYVIDPYSRNFFNRIRFRVGISYGNSYTNISVYNPSNNTSAGIGGFKEYGVNIGLGLPFRDSLSGRLSLFNIGFGYTTQRPDLQYMIKQDMFKISLNMNINEFWFFKRQFN